MDKQSYCCSEIVVCCNKNQVFNNKKDNYLEYEIVVSDNDSFSRIKNIEKKYTVLKTRIKKSFPIYLISKNKYNGSFGGNFVCYEDSSNTNLVKMYIRIFYEFVIWRGDRFMASLDFFDKSYNEKYVLKKFREYANEIMRKKLFEKLKNKNIMYFQKESYDLKKIIEEDLLVDLMSIYGVKISLSNVVVEN